MEQVKGLPDWRAQVRHEAALACPDGPTDRPVGMHLTFVYSRPKSHYGTGKNSRRLKPHAPDWPATRNIGDLDKTCRAILDAVTGVLVTDDSLVVTLVARKVYGFPERCEVSCSSGVVPLGWADKEAS